MECTRLVALTVTVAAALGTVLAVPAWRLGSTPAPVPPTTGAASGPRTVVLASGAPVHTVRATNRAW